MEDSARASEAQAASKQGEADTLRQAVAAHRTEAEGLDRQAALREQDATPWRTLAQSFGPGSSSPPEISSNACSMPSTASWPADPRPLPIAISAQAEVLRMQAQALRDVAGTKERQAETLAAEARGLLAEATQAREDAARLGTEADALITRAEAAEALAADYRALASNSPAGWVVTHYPYDLEGRLLGEYDEEGYVQREYVYLDGMPLAQWAPTHDRFEGTEIYYYHLPSSQRALHLEETYGLHGDPRFK